MTISNKRRALLLVAGTTLLSANVSVIALRIGDNIPASRLAMWMGGLTAVATLSASLSWDLYNGGDDGAVAGC